MREAEGEIYLVIVKEYHQSSMNFDGNHKGVDGFCRFLLVHCDFYERVVQNRVL